MKRSTLRTIAAALFLLVVSVLMLWRATAIRDQDEPASILWQNVGSFVLASLVIGLIFQFWQVRGLVEDMWEQAEIVKSLRSARISRFGLDFQEADIPWAQYFRESDQVSILFMFGTTWREWHLSQLREFLKKEKAHLEVILPDAEDDGLMRALALRFLDADEIKRRIEDAARGFARLGSSGKGKVSLFAFSKPLVYSCYRFDTHAVLATYRHRSDKGPIITMVGERGGELYTFVEDELRWITTTGLTEGTVREIDIDTLLESKSEPAAPAPTEQPDPQ